MSGSSDVAGPKRYELVLVLETLVALSHAALAHAIAGVVGRRWAVLVAGALFGLTAHRIWALFRPGRHRQWVIEWIDLPTFCHAAAGFGALAGTAVALALGRAFTHVADLAAAGYLGGLLLAAWGIWGQRRRLHVRAIEVPTPGLPEAFDGYRIVHLSDLHVGDFEPPDRALRWVRASNELEADLCVVTGDLVAGRSGCALEASRVVGTLEARDGVLVTMGNHDFQAAETLTRELRAAGVMVLRNQWHPIVRRDESLWVLGVDDWRSGPSDLESLLAERPSGAPFVLLAHRCLPSRAVGDWPVALAVSGHTHGGQIGLPFLGRWVNLMTLTGQRARGLFPTHQGWVHISAGLGTSGPPLRLAIDPEIVVLVLRVPTCTRCP